MIEVREIGCRVGDKVLLEDVSFDLAEGELLAVVGPNGAGKSTLLKCLSGEREIDAGRILVRGTSLHCEAAALTARWRAVLPQANPIPFAFSARDVVLLGRSPHVVGREKPHDYEIVEAAMRATDAWHLAARSVQTLSGGELQRVHMARVLAQIWDPGEDGRLLLLDEPTAALDLKHQHALLQLARQWADLGAAVLIILHDIGQAARYSDTLLWLKDGRTAALGPPRETVTENLIQRVFEVGVTVNWTEKAFPVIEITG